MSFSGATPSGGSRFDQEMFDEREREIEQAAEAHREETDGEPRKPERGRLIDRVRAALRRHDSP